MPTKADVTVAIEIYRMELSDYFRWFTVSFVVMILFPIPGLFWFIKRIRQKKRLDKQKIEIQQMLQEISTSIPLEEYLSMRKRFTSARQY